MTRSIAAALAAMAIAGIAGTASADGDAAKGEKVYGKCKACHQVGDGASNRVGPQLTGIVGRVAGSADGFKYSDAMMAKNAEGMTWGEAELDAYLAKPKDFLPGTKMSFAGLRKEDDREDVIAYLKTFQ